MNSDTVNHLNRFTQGSAVMAFLSRESGMSAWAGNGPQPDAAKKLYALADALESGTKRVETIRSANGAICHIVRQIK